MKYLIFKLFLKTTAVLKDLRRLFLPLLTLLKTLWDIKFRDFSHLKKLVYCCLEDSEEI